MCHMKQRRLLAILLIIILIVLNITGVYADNDITASLEEADHSVGLNAFDDSFIPDGFFENSTSIVPLATYYESDMCIRDSRRMCQQIMKYTYTNRMASG